MIHHIDDHATVMHGDCIELMRTLPDNSIDSIVTDPPYGLGFMGKAWDDLPPGLPWAQECLRVLKPGGHLLAFGGSRTWHRLAVAVEDAGFEIRDSIAWLYGSGFPKSLDVSKAIDKMDASEERTERAREFQSWLRKHLTPQQVNAATGTDMGHHLTTHPTQPSVATADLFDRLRPLLPEVPERIEALVAERTVESGNFKARKVTGQAVMVDTSRSRLGFAGETYGGDSSSRSVDLTAAHTDEAKQWQGWGTALKPAFEPIVMGRKPFPGTVAGNVLEHGTGALNIDATRIRLQDNESAEKLQARSGGVRGFADKFVGGAARGAPPTDMSKGRWPANVLLDESQAAALDQQSGTLTSGGGIKGSGANGFMEERTSTRKNLGADYSPDRGGASRFFFTGKGDTIETCETANTAPPSSSPPSTPAASAPNDAVTSEAHEAAFSPLHSAAPSTNATATESKPKSARNTQQTPSTEPKSSPESKQQKRTPTRNPASNAEQAEQTGTTTTTPSRSISDGSAGAATSSTTPNSAAHGGPASPLETLDARFIYCAKAPKSERPNVDGVQHPTVKPLAVMRWLLRLVTPPGGITLDTFAGSGATVEAAILENFYPIAMEREAEYLPLIMARVERSTAPVGVE